MVIDASMTIAWLLEDESDDFSNAVVDRVALEGATVPALWRLEVANVLRASERRGRCEADFVDQSLARLQQLPIAVDGETNERAWNETLELARDENLTVYDASYLELAIRLKLPLATRDAELICAAARHRVATVGH